MSGQLMLLPQSALDAAKRAAKRKGHAGNPGSGPDGETCKTCEHYTLRQLASTYRKCGLMRRSWTGGAGTDIRAGDPACDKWEASGE